MDKSFQNLTVQNTTVTRRLRGCEILLSGTLKAENAVVNNLVVNDSVLFPPMVAEEIAEEVMQVMPEPLSVRTAFVSPTNGDNGTAILENRLYPYQTIGAAITALQTLGGTDPVNLVLLKDNYLWDLDLGVAAAGRDCLVIKIEAGSRVLFDAVTVLNIAAGETVVIEGFGVTFAESNPGSTAVPLVNNAGSLHWHAKTLSFTEDDLITGFSANSITVLDIQQTLTTDSGSCFVEVGGTMDLTAPIISGGDFSIFVGDFPDTTVRVKNDRYAAEGFSLSINNAATNSSIHFDTVYFSNNNSGISFFASAANSVVNFQAGAMETPGSGMSMFTFNGGQIHVKCREDISVFRFSVGANSRGSLEAPNLTTSQVNPFDGIDIQGGSTQFILKVPGTVNTTSFLVRQLTSAGAYVNLECGTITVSEEFNMEGCTDPGAVQTLKCTNLISTRNVTPSITFFLFGRSVSPLTLTHTAGLIKVDVDRTEIQYAQLGGILWQIAETSGPQAVIDMRLGQFVRVPGNNVSPQFCSSGGTMLLHDTFFQSTGGESPLAVGSTTAPDVATVQFINCVLADMSNSNVRTTTAAPGQVQVSMENCKVLGSMTLSGTGGGNPIPPMAFWAEGTLFQGLNFVMGAGLVANHKISLKSCHFNNGTVFLNGYNDANTTIIASSLTSDTATTASFNSNVIPTFAGELLVDGTASFNWIN
jgi:hypothetical protein